MAMFKKTVHFFMAYFMLYIPASSVYAYDTQDITTLVNNTAETELQVSHITNADLKLINDTIYLEQHILVNDAKNKTATLSQGFEPDVSDIDTTIQPNNMEDDAFGGFDDEETNSTPANSISQPLRVKAYDDPLESYNRFMFDINLGLDRNIVKPVAIAYKENTPSIVQKGVNNFFNNLAEPWDSVNLLLQGKPLASLESLTRFGVNTITTLGFADPAGELLNLPNQDADFGQTLGVWGVPSGPYVVLPFFGPSTVRDSAGRLVDMSYGSPTAYLEDTKTKLAVSGAKALDKRVQLMGFEGIIEPTYEIVRDAFYQKREYEIKEHKNTGYVNQIISSVETNNKTVEEQPSPDQAFDDASFGD